MVVSKRLGESQSKTEQIVTVAQKRFGQYGFEKTTMNEIASDLNMCKGSLYYYFPDKEHLYIAVTKKEHDFFVELVREKMATLTDASEMIREYVNIRVSYWGKLLNLSRLRHDYAHELHSLMHGLWAEFRTQEEDMITNILNVGIANGQFEACNVDEHTELLLDAMKGLSMSALRNKDIFYLEAHEYDRLLRMINLFVEMFVKSLRK
ncbi:TetR/AcrR family transcriptional regulator [uncultured Bacteroides sp.]|uniref:TetR/AcrR family transcriptional regulator n=1 Tax=uncultured Bacteroides sp. TaxID=162156 RepID=UPI002AA94E40|nr:TetR/AcrR family transcriptional regulator [uncultured Bacteroides sp.]